MASDDVVKDGSIKAPECGKIASYFGMCARGEVQPASPVAPAPLSTNLNTGLNRDTMQNTVKDAEQGKFGGLMQDTAGAVGARQKVLDDLMKP